MCAPLVLPLAALINCSCPNRTNWDRPWCRIWKGFNGWQNVSATATAGSTTFCHEANVNNFHWTLAVKSVQESICTAMAGSAMPNALVAGAQPEVKSKRRASTAAVPPTIIDCEWKVGVTDGTPIKSENVAKIVDDINWHLAATGISMRRTAQSAPRQKTSWGRLAHWLTGWLVEGKQLLAICCNR